MENWINSITLAFQEAVNTVVTFLPQLIAGIIIFIIGVLIASALREVVVRVLQMISIDSFFEKFGFQTFLKRFNQELTVSKAFGWMVKWFVILITIIMVAESLGLQEVTRFFEEVLLYIPNVIAAVIILLVGMAGGRAVEHIVVGSLKGFHGASAQLVGTIAKWAIVVFTVIIALEQLRIAPELMNTLLAGFVAMIALAGGLAFGLGGKDLARDVLENMRKDLKE